jgi:hypothetical protein
MIRLPLVMKLFAEPQRVRGLTHLDIQSILDAVLFEPGPWAPPEVVELPKEIPAPTRAHMATPVGLLAHELINCPAPLADSAEELLALSLELDTGRHDAPKRSRCAFRHTHAHSHFGFCGPHHQGELSGCRVHDFHRYDERLELSNVRDDGTE